MVLFQVALVELVVCLPSLSHHVQNNHVCASFFFSSLSKYKSFNLLQKLLTSQYTSFMQPLVKLIDPTFNVSNESQKDIENMTVFIGFAFQIAIP